ncbi:GNAT family N-acetyltransferase [Vibrio hepatarius]|uniref:GNAT family N-acetyltransferase n=1 Tax=Vibrio hepatarius TaxID=171383 RepID=UPI001C08122A|nr:GNAT family N-acetyltransferase [Vibrio hepatarius]MBU2897502.1 GNAT family N-acetyltransferase [Vibrio hepatarius]
MIFEFSDPANQSNIITPSGLIFMPISVDDAEHLFDAFNAKAFHPDLVLSKINTLGKAEQWCSKRLRDWQTSECFVWTCRHQENLSFIGQITLTPRDKDFALAYWVMPTQRGRGYATTMCNEVLAYIRNRDYQGKIWAGVHTWNKPSINVLSKLGFEQMESQDDLIREFHLKIN